MATAEPNDPRCAADAAAAAEAVRVEGSFNVVHIESAVKVDIFVSGADPLDQGRLRRRQRIVLKGADVTSSLEPQGNRA